MPSVTGEGDQEHAMHELIEFESPVQHPAQHFFAERCQELISTRKIRGDDGTYQRLTPRHIARLLKRRAPDIAISETQFYRYFHGDVAPRIDVVYEVAAIFGVSPRSFLPDTGDEAEGTVEQ
jgi:hypothetical protein